MIYKVHKLCSLISFTMSQPCRLSIKFPRLDYHDYIDRVTNKELYACLRERGLIPCSDEESAMVSERDVNECSLISVTFSDGDGTPIVPPSPRADGNELEQAYSSPAVRSVQSPPDSSPVEPTIAEPSEASAADPPSPQALSIISRRSKDPSTTSSSSRRHKWLGDRHRTEDALSPPLVPHTTVDFMSASTTSRLSTGEVALTTSPSRSQGALESLKGILSSNASQIPRIFTRPGHKGAESEAPAYKRRKTLFTASTSGSDEPGG